MCLASVPDWPMFCPEFKRTEELRHCTAPQASARNVSGQHPNLTDLTRREALTARGATLGNLAAYTNFARDAECVLTSRQIDGPYHIPDMAERRDVRSGRQGVDLLLRLKVVDGVRCEAIASVSKPIWSCDALGN